MAYKQSPANVLKGQMTNKAVGLAHGDSMAMQIDPKDNEQLDNVTVSAKKKTPQTKTDLLNLIKSQGEYDTNVTNVSRNLAELDSLNLVAGGDRKRAQYLYGSRYSPNRPIGTSTSTWSTQYKEQQKKKKQLQDQAKQILGPRPSLNN